jgi:SAM-dependent methyltransferase
MWFAARFAARAGRGWSSVDAEEAVSEYSDPLLYDAENPDPEPDASFYRKLSAEVPGPILDLGCGTGRITLALAGSGLEVTGLDLSPEMLARARSKDTEHKVEWIQGDARSFDLMRTFALIIETGGTFQHLLARGMLSLRYFYPQEIEALLHYNGYQVTARYGDLDASPLTDNSGPIIYGRATHSGSPPE